MSYDVFISYSHYNKAIADAVCAQLERDNIRCWYAPRDIQPGEDWAESIIKTIESVKVMVIIYTDESNVSKQVLNEIANAVQAGVIIIPFKLTDTQPSRSMKYYFASVHWLDAVDKPLERSIQELSKEISLIIKNRPTEVSEQKKEPLPRPRKKKKTLLLVAVISSLMLAATGILILSQPARRFFSFPEQTDEPVEQTVDLSANNQKNDTSPTVLDTALTETPSPSVPTPTPISDPDSDYDYQIIEGAAWITRYRGSASKLEIPRKINGLMVCGIAENAFNPNYTLTEVTLPETVTHIGNSAFANCTVLEQVSIPTSVVSIGARAFYRCIWLHKLIIPDSVTSLDTNHLFDSCSALTSVKLPASLTSLQEGAFRNCTRLVEIQIPDSVIKIDENALTGCPATLYVRSGSPADQCLEALGLKHLHTKTAAMTVMVYMSGANMESEYGTASAKIQEMIESGFDDDSINLLIMVGGAKKWANGYDPDQTTIIQCSALRKAARVVKKLPAMSMGEPETLSTFLRYAAENFPADAYSLIFWGNGLGPLGGFCHDGKYMDALTLEELDSALSASPFSSKKLAWIGFDIPLSATIETAHILSPYAAYMIASQSEENMDGWDYHFLKGLESDPDGEQTGKRIIDAVFMDQESYAYRALSCVRLDEINNVEASMDELFIKIAGLIDQGTFSGFEKGRGFALDSDKMKIYAGADLVDLVSLCNALVGDDPEGAARTKEAVEKAVVYARSEDNLCCGLMAYHPYKGSFLSNQEWIESYRRLNFCPGYTAYIVVFTRFLLGDAPKI